MSYKNQWWINTRKHLVLNACVKLLVASDFERCVYHVSVCLSKLRIMSLTRGLLNVLRHHMDAGGRALDSERGRSDAGADGAELGPSAVAGGTPGDAAQFRPETVSSHLCYSLPSHNDERVLLQNKAQGNNNNNNVQVHFINHKSCASSSACFALCFRFWMSCVTRKTCSRPHITTMEWPHTWWTRELKTSSWRSSSTETVGFQLSYHPQPPYLWLWIS